MLGLLLDAERIAADELHAPSPLAHLVTERQLFYLACRGLDQNAAEDLFVRAKLEDAALSATDERTRAAVVRLGNNLIDNFEEELA